MAKQPQPPSLESLGFVKAGTEVTPRLIMAIDGLEKQGKTHFAFTAPGPIAYFSTDVGDEGVIQKFIAAGKTIYRFDLDVPHKQKEAEEEWNKYMVAYAGVLKMPEVRTVVTDTGTELWELLRMGEFGKLTQVMPHNYGPVNAQYRRMIRQAYESDKNLLLLHKMKSKYVNDKRTANYERAGFSDTGFLVQVNVQVYRDPPYTDEEGMVHSGDFNLYVNDCRQNPDLAGMVLSGPMCNFPTLASMVLPETNPSDWE